MGFISKLEDKLTGSDKHEEQKKLEKQGTSYSQGTSEYGSSEMQNTTTGSRVSERQHPISSATEKGSGIVGGTAVTGGAGSEAFTGSHGYGNDRNVSSTSDKLRDTHLGSSTGSDGPRQPFNPYSSKGQQIAANAGQTTTGYGASQGRAEAGDIGSRRSAADPEVTRTQHGGVSNGMEDQTFTTGPHSHLENRDAVPTAGGHKLGSGTTSSVPGSYDSYENTSSTSHGQNHYGRDAALAGGAGAAGYGAYEASKSHDSTGPAPNTAGPHRSDMLNKVDPRLDSDQSKTQHGRDAGISGVSSDKYGSSTTTSSSNYLSTTSRSHEPSGIDHRTYDTSSSTTSANRHGQDVSYMNRPPADTPLTQSKDFSECHPHSTTAAAAGAGVGAGALGASALSHRQGDVSEARNVSGGSYAGQTSSTTTGGGYGSSQPGVTGPTTGGLTSTTSGSGDHAARGSEMAKRMGGAYEAGYKDGYRDAMEHKAAQV